MKRAPQGLKKDLLIGLSLRGLGAVASFAFVWLIAYEFGARVVGLYQIGFMTITLLSTIAVLGQDVMLVRAVSPLLRDGNLDETRAVYRSAHGFVLRFGLLMALAGLVSAVPLASLAFQQPGAAPYLALLAPLILLMPWLKLQNALIRSFGMTKISQSLEGVFYTSFAMLAFLLVIMLGGWSQPLLIPGFVVCGVGLCVAYGHRVVQAQLGIADGPAAKPDLRAGAWVAAAPFLGAFAGWLISLLISAQLGAGDVGIFRVAVQVCLLMQLINSSFATMAGPYLSRAAQAGDLAMVRRTALVAGVIGAMISAPLVLAIWVAPGPIMGLFGDEFVKGTAALQLLAIGHLIDVAAGPVGVAMVMQKRERTVLIILGLATVIGVALAFVLVPVLGLAGAAIGTMAIAIIRNIANWVVIHFFSGEPEMPAGPPAA